MNVDISARTEDAGMALVRAAASVMETIRGDTPTDDGLLTAVQLPVGCAVKVAGQWCGFEGMRDGAMVLSTSTAGFTYIPSVGERFVWASPF